MGRWLVRVPGSACIRVPPAPSRQRRVMVRLVRRGSSGRNPPGSLRHKAPTMAVWRKLRASFQGSISWSEVTGGPLFVSAVPANGQTNFTMT